MDRKRIREGQHLDLEVGPWRNRKLNQKLNKKLHKRLGEKVNKKLNKKLSMGRPTSRSRGWAFA